MTKIGEGNEFDNRYAESKHYHVQDTDKAEDDLEAINEWDEA
jgi:hypothetical protein